MLMLPWRRGWSRAVDEDQPGSGRRAEGEADVRTLGEVEARRARYLQRIRRRDVADVDGVGLEGGAGQGHADRRGRVETDERPAAEDQARLVRRAQREAEADPSARGQRGRAGRRGRIRGGHVGDRDVGAEKVVPARVMLKFVVASRPVSAPLLKTRPGLAGEPRVRLMSTPWGSRS